MGTYPPRECGIATFNQDLITSSQKFLGDEILCKVVAMNLSTLDTYAYPPEVKWEIDQDNIPAHKKLAIKFNKDPLITGVMIQHEYGIYGGLDGINILSFIENCNKPIVVTLHTVLPNPSQNMKDVTSRIIKHANIVVVLTENSKKILEEVYPHSFDKVHVIPHGIHHTTFSKTTKAKKKLNLENTIVLSTFGLLSRGKGIEYVINSLPNLVKKHPKILYLILGETHPIVRRQEGESYRLELAELVKKLRLKKHVRFYDQYLTLSNLFEFLKATDIYISTSINPNQAVSGTLSYALGTGRAVISTEFAQAKEIITTKTGRLVQIEDSEAYTLALSELLENKDLLKNMHKSAYELTRPMLWINVADQYSKLLKQNILPPVNLSHLSRMTDDFGLFQFATLSTPNKEYGYTLDDNARALVLCCWLPKSISNTKHIQIYLDFIKECQLPDGSFINYIDHFHKKATNQNISEDLEDATARAMWGLSEIMKNLEISDEIREKASSIFVKAMPKAQILFHIRSSSLIIKAFSNILTIYPAYSDELISSIKTHADSLINKLTKSSVKEWVWFDDYLGYNNAIIPEALFIAGNITNTSLYTKSGNITLNFLIDKTFSQNRYLPIGHSHWYKNNNKRSHFDQQPEDPTSMILALATVYKINQDERYRKLIDICFSWFLGNNSVQLPLYNYQNGGCYDGLHPDRVNLNQGAESQVSYLLARLTIANLPRKYHHENPKN
jgi:glycosyltransferase involved in cell wall biosynthesis